MKARIALAFFGSIAVIALLAVTVFPTRLWMRQKSDLASVQNRVQILQRTNAALQQRVDELGTDSAIERIAREQHNLVKPGEDAFAVLPPAGDAPALTRPPALAPASKSQDRGFLERLRDRLSFWI